MKNPYDHFPQYVLRTPIFSIDFIEKLTSQPVVTKAQLKAAFDLPIVKESCFLASPSLYAEIEKWLNASTEVKKEKKLRLSLLKYLTRMATRCTPFGLFAGCGTGNFAEHTEIELSSPQSYKRHTGLDMNYLVALSQDLSKKKAIREQLPFYPNSSMYPIGDTLRYIEYYYQNSRRQHHIIEVDFSDYLKNIVYGAVTGATLEHLVKILTEKDIPKDQASDFLNELIDSQILVGAMEPSVSGPAFLEQIQHVLSPLQHVEAETLFLETTKKRIGQLDERMGNDPKSYLDIATHLQTGPTTYNLQYLFQTNLQLAHRSNQLSNDIAKSVKQAMTLLNRMTPVPRETNLTKFKNAFRERYEEREMPLAKVMDVETGIGYLQTGGSGDVNPLVDDLLLPQTNSNSESKTLNWHPALGVLEKKLITSDENGNTPIILEDKDFEEMSAHWDDLPDTLSAMVSVIEENGEQKILLPGVGGSSAANLLGRFCHGDPSLALQAQKITAKEEQLNPDKILAEIVHLPESRVGNILTRPSFRTHEIPYLAKSAKSLEKQLPISDLYISIRNDRILLRSKKNNMEVLPRLTNAHNFSANALPIYHFLCDLQNQGLRGGLYFRYGYLGENRSFLPRVTYRNLIFHRATWNIDKEQLTTLSNVIDDEKALLQKIKIWQSQLKLPQYVVLTEGDNELLINFSNATSVQMLLDSVKNKSQFTLSEFLFSKEGTVSSAQGHYSNQMIISFYNRSERSNEERPS